MSQIDELIKANNAIVRTLEERLAIAELTGYVRQRTSLARALNVVLDQMIAIGHTNPHLEACKAAIEKELDAIQGFIN
jgi:hypothetical protein